MSEFAAPESAGLVGAILADKAPGPAEAFSIIASALALGVDPMDYLMQRFGLPPSLAYGRAAAWAGLGFAEALPGRPRPLERLAHPDALAGVRTLRVAEAEGDMLYCTPRFAEFLKLRAHAGPKPRLCVVPPQALLSALATAAEPLLVEACRTRLARRWPYACASLDLTAPVRIGFVALLAGALVLAGLAPFPLGAAVAPLALAFLAIPALVRLAALLQPARPWRGPAPPGLTDAELPTYSVLVPLRDEAAMVPQLHQALLRLDYPPEKLEIVFVVERASSTTVAAVEPLLADARFRLLVVPHAAPHTKPKALDFALPFLRGSRIVVFDAEDMPDPDQLRRAAARFAAEPDLDCLQAVLVMDNAGESWLTSLFAGEYAGQFTVMLPALARWGLPMPLGGTSNHFRTAVLREIGGWDAFNVTEDADLGIRLARLRRRTGVLAACTREEAPVTLRPWLRQRTRWMKGWMQTLIVHNRRPAALWRDLGWRGFLAFEIYVGGLILAPLLHSAFALALLAGALFPEAGLGLPARGLTGALQVAVLILGYGAAGAITAVGLLQVGAPRLLAVQALLPFYWFLHAVAVLRAAHELLRRPYFWAKTEHGRTRIDRSEGSRPAIPRHPGRRGALRRPRRAFTAS